MTNNAEDSFIFNSPIWYVILQDNEEIYQDDDRENEVPASAWLRLMEYKRDRKIIEFGLKFRSNKIKLNFPANPDGFFFSKKMISGGFGTLQVYAYMVGYVLKETIYIETYQVPELTLIEQESRHISKGLDKIIWEMNEVKTGCQSLGVENSGSKNLNHKTLTLGLSPMHSV